ncbi:MAG TPA: pyridoxal phosphate-dependent aminotransferase [Pseudolabrys sp.]|nr:pyridoxal phosphate-dependent aminotransferase [Pseudolabrys sp.]
MRFPETDIISLIESGCSVPRYDLAESVGPVLQLTALLQPPGSFPLEDIPLGYATAAGDIRLRETIAERHAVSPDDVVLTVGGMHALFLIAFILCEKGDEALTTSPAFPGTRSALEVIVGANLRTLPLSFDRGYQLDVDEFRSALSPRTKLVSLASPQNPSGVALAEPTIRNILAAMEEQCPNAHLLLDETYREAAYGTNPIASSAIALGPKVISVASLSKCHGAPGLRLGWAITRDKALRKQLVIGKFNTVISCSPVDEALALRVLAQRDSIINARRIHLAEGLSRVAEWVQRNSDLIEWVRPDAGALCCLRLTSVFDGEAVGRFYQALARFGVRVGRGTWFGEEVRIFRLGFGFLAPSDLEIALEMVTRSLRHAAQQAVEPVS